MTTVAQRLFGHAVQATHPIASIVEASPEPLRLARATGRSVLADYQDVPERVEEAQTGLAVIGSTHALWMGRNGDVIVRPLGEAKARRQSLPSKFPDSSYGFLGTVRQILGGGAAVFEAMSKALLAKYPQYSAETIRDFLDSQNGRNLADYFPTVLGSAGDDGYSLDKLLTAVPKVIASDKRLDKSLTAFSKLPPESQADASESVEERQGKGGIGQSFTIRMGGAKVTAVGQGNRGQITYAKVVQVEDGEHAGVAKGDTIARKARGSWYIADETDESALYEDSGDAEVFLNLWDFVEEAPGKKLDATPLRFLRHPAWNKGMTVATKAASAAMRETLVASQTFADDLRKGGLQFKTTTTSESKEFEPMKTRLQEDDYAEIVVDDNGLVLLVNDEAVAREDCDLRDPEDCVRAEAALTTKAEDMGFVAESTKDASYESGGAVINGDEQDDWLSGESYYDRRYRRRTAVAEAAKKKGRFMPDEEDDEDDEEYEDDEDVEERLIAGTSAFLSRFVDPVAQLADVREFDRLVSEGDYEGAVELAETLAEAARQLDEYKRLQGSRLSRFRRSLRTTTSGERTRNRQRRREYRTNASARRKKKIYARRVKRFRRRTESAPTSRRPALAEASRLAGELAAPGGRAYVVVETEEGLDVMPANRAGNAKVLYRTDKPLGEAEGHTDTSLAAAVGGKASTDEQLRQACVQCFSDMKGQPVTFAGMKAEGVGDGASDAQLMRAVSKLVNLGAVRYEPGQGYVLEQVGEEALGKLAQAARRVGNKFVVTLRGGTPMFLPTQEDALELWQSIPASMRGTKLSLTRYMAKLGMEAESEEPEDATT